MLSQSQALKITTMFCLCSVQDRSVRSESAGLHARNNGKDNGMQLRKEELILETLL